MVKQRRNYVAPKLSALGKLASLTNAINCTSFANKIGYDPDDMSTISPLLGDPKCL